MEDDQGLRSQRKALGTKVACNMMESPWMFFNTMRALTLEADKIGWDAEDLDVQIEIKISSRTQQPQLIVPALSLVRDD